MLIMSLKLLKRAAESQFKKSQTTVAAEERQQRIAAKKAKRKKEAKERAKTPLTLAEREARNQKLDDRIMEQQFRDSFAGRKITAIDKKQEAFKRLQRENHFKSRSVSVKKAAVDQTAVNLAARKKAPKKSDAADSAEQEEAGGGNKLDAFLKTLAEEKEVKRLKAIGLGHNVAKQGKSKKNKKASGKK